MSVTLFIFEVGLTLGLGVWVCVSDGVTVIHKYCVIAKKLKINKSTLFLNFSPKKKKNKTNGACGPDSCLLGVVFLFVCLFGIFVLDRHRAMTILVPIPNRGKQLCLPDKLMVQFGGEPARGAGVAVGGEVFVPGVNYLLLLSCTQAEWQPDSQSVSGAVLSPQIPSPQAAAEVWHGEAVRLPLPQVRCSGGTASRVLFRQL